MPQMVVKSPHTKGQCCWEYSIKAVQLLMTDYSFKM